jgi:hypothetical protein
MRRKTMLDYVKRLLVVLVIAACIGVLFIGGRSTKAMGIEPQFDTPHTLSQSDISIQK